MIVRRWQASAVPSVEQIEHMLRAEGLEPTREIYQGPTQVPEHMHPFDEIRMVAVGEIMMEVSGNRLLLRSGDRIDIPSNTRHSTLTQGSGTCIAVCAQRPF